MGMERLRNPAEPCIKAPKSERQLRDNISRALTNIGAHVSNSGYPDRAVEHFRRSIGIFHDNPNSHVCLGRMSIMFHEQTGLDPIDGISSWEAAARIGDSCDESDRGCVCRENVTRFARQVERDYGKREARDWIKRYAKASIDKRGSILVPIAKEPSDAIRLAPAKWHPDAAVIAEVIQDLVFANARLRPLEFKVTLAATLLAAMVRLNTPFEEGDATILDRAYSTAEGIEPLYPFLGDDEWEWRGPPDTLYLSESKCVDEIQKIIILPVEAIRTRMRGTKPENAVLGVLFHLDNGFRSGVISMVREFVGPARVPYLYVPGTFVGSQAKQ